MTQASGTGSPGAVAPVPAPAASARPLVLAVAVALTVAVAAAFAVLAPRGGEPPAHAQAVTQAGAEGPGDATAVYAEGEAVDVYWHTSWWPGTIKRVQGEGSYRIGYDGWASSWDEDVTPRRLRRRQAPLAADPARAPAPASKGDPNASYRAGDAVDIHWGSRWWPGRVVRVKGRHYDVTYDGWASSHDETVDASRLRRR